MSLQRPRLPLSLLTVGLALSNPYALAEDSVVPVSYTHLTLPTILLV